MKPREAAYLSVLTSLRHEKFIVQSLEEWQRQQNPASLDFAFAYEIAAGSARMAQACDYIAEHFSSKQKLNLKAKERALLHTAIYQHYFMDKVPLYAIVNETIELAKKYCHLTFANYLNALLRKMGEEEFALPNGTSVYDLSIRHSYPVIFVEKLIKELGEEQALHVLMEGNKTPQKIVRVRPGAKLKDGMVAIQDTSAAIVDNSGLLKELAGSKDYYIQNVTPAVLMTELAAKTAVPGNILDMCASPGGKLLAAHDAFPQAQLYGNDVSQEKIDRLVENLTKYGVSAQLSCGDGTKYGNENESQVQFDVVILDVPCSNSGVLNKRPEARWRLTKEALRALKQTQWGLLKKASTLLSESGVIWYLTCSILQEENEALMAEFCKHYPFKVEYKRMILPQAGWDGGFACLLKKV